MRRCLARAWHATRARGAPVALGLQQRLQSLAVVLHTEHGDHAMRATLEHIDELLAAIAPPSAHAQPAAGASLPRR